MSKCDDCGCYMSGGFCSNCHEEVYIVEQCSEMGIEISPEIHNKANEHINNPNRIKQAKKIREQEAKKLKERYNER